MEIEFRQLMDTRHVAFVAAEAKGFADAALTEAWRAANRNYVHARDARLHCDLPESEPGIPVRMGRPLKYANDRSRREAQRKQTAERVRRYREQQKSACNEKVAEAQ